jgi:exodeoxyribonuclease VII large subunit
MTEIVTNAPELTVSELSSALKRTLEDRFGFVRVRGEISGYRGPHSSGHAYFSLKDQNARLDAVIWKQTFARMRVRPTEGLEVIASGRITSFPGKSAYQIIIETLEPAGIGALMALLEERRRRLAAEGLFDAARKKPLPFLPAVIGVVTSPTGAVIRDILHRLADRFPRRVILWPARMQGESCAAEVAAAIQGLNDLPPTGPIPRPSVIIVARGGGSLEDLWGFNDEAVVRAAADSRVPIISAVGHETDWTLLDHVADMRAPTPTGAAELSVPVRLDLITQLADLSRRCAQAERRLLAARRTELRALVRGLPSGEAFVATARQRLDRAEEQIAGRLRDALRERHLRIGRAAAALARHSPQAELARRRERLSGLGLRISRARANFPTREAAMRREKLDALRDRVGRAARLSRERLSRRSDQAFQLLKSFGYHNVLARGYALVRDSGGRPLRSAALVAPGARLLIGFADGAVAATADGPSPARRKSGHAEQTPRNASDQGALF